jgi:hypothetical protein
MDMKLKLKGENITESKIMLFAQDMITSLSTSQYIVAETLKNSK